MLKRKRPESSGVNKALTADEQAVYNIIKSKTNMGISKLDLKRALTMRDRVFNSCIKSLQTKSKIKEVKSVKNKKGHLMAMEFEPSNELTGGVWYSEGQLDTDFIEKLMKICMAKISKTKVATAEQVAEMVAESGAINVKIYVDQIKEILKTLVLDNEIVEVKSTGLGVYGLIPAGENCYKSARKVKGGEGAMVSIPCGVCPRINQCTPDGVISPITCEYFNQWLDF